MKDNVPSQTNNINNEVQQPNVNGVQTTPVQQTNNVVNNQVQQPNQSVVQTTPVRQTTDNSINIVETQVSKSSNGSVTLAKVENGTINIVNSVLPDPIDIKAKPVKETVKNGKKVKIVTKRELIINVLLTVILLVGVIGGAYGVYTYILKDNPKNFVANNVTVEYGSEIPQSVTYYINLKDISEPEYTLDLSSVSNEVGTYTYKVSYGNTTKTGNITIEDTTAPVITFKTDLEFTEGTTITKDMLVDACTDLSECTYEIFGTIDNATVGTTTAYVSASDKYGNEKTYEVEITIKEKIIYLDCTKEILTNIGDGYIKIDTYNLEFNGSKYLKTGKLTQKYTYVNMTYWENDKNNLANDGYTIEERNATKVDENLTNVANLTNQDEINTHLTGNGYRCTIKESN